MTNLKKTLEIINNEIKELTEQYGKYPKDKQANKIMIQLRRHKREIILQLELKGSLR